MIRTDCTLPNCPHSQLQPNENHARQAAQSHVEAAGHIVRVHGPDARVDTHFTPDGEVTDADEATRLVTEQEQAHVVWGDAAF